MTPETRRSPRLPPFSTELLLHQAVAGLLSRMPNVTDVEILHGAQEYGKDIVFRSIGPMSDAIVCACVIKRDRITGRVGQSASARAVFHQAEQALDTPYTDGTGRDIWVDRVYIVSPQPIPQTTISSIRGNLANRRGQIIFIGADKLFELFRAHWVDFLSDEFYALDAYVARVKGLADESAIHAIIAQYGLGDVSSEDVRIYVPRLLAQVLPSWEYTSPFVTLFPILELIRTKLTKSQVSKIRSDIAFLCETLVHIDKWGFLHLPRESTVAELTSDLRGLDEYLVSSWLTIVRSSLGRQLLSLADVPEKKTSKADEELPWQWNLSDPHSVEERFVQARARTDAALEPLKAAFTTSQQIANDERGVDVLDDPAWKVVGAAAECLGGIAHPLWEAKPGARCQLSEADLHPFKNDVFMIVGAAGLGKTSFCRWNALVDAELLACGESSILPVFVPLHHLSNLPLADFDAAFLRTAGHSGLLATGNPPNQKQVRLYLDGLDEVATQAKREEIIELLFAGLATRRNIQAVITARDYITGPWLRWMRRLELAPLTVDQIAELEQRWLGRSETLLRDFREQVEGTALRPLMAIPLLATLILLVFRQTRRLPENRARLYTTFIDLLCGGWDIAKGVVRPSNYGRVIKTTILADIAESTHRRGARDFTEDQFERAVRRTVSASTAAGTGELLGELLADGVVSRSGDRLFFSHLSFQEFLTARRYLGEPHAKGVSAALARYLEGEAWWAEVLRFYIGLSENPQEVTYWLKSNVGRRDEASLHAINRLLRWLEEAFPGFHVGWQFAPSTRTLR